MRKVRKKKGNVVRACCLGSGSPLELELMQRGCIRRLPDGGYEIFSREAKDGRGELASAGDYVKLDAGGNPYPNDRAFFEANHDWIDGENYCQRSRTVSAWQLGDAPCDAIDFLLERGRLHIDPQSEEKYFSAVLWGAPLSAARDAVIVFYAIERDDQGGVADVDFNFVVREEYEAAYEELED